MAPLIVDRGLISIVVEKEDVHGVKHSTFAILSAGYKVVLTGTNGK
jgi:hypothetical protein